jgi:oligoendopeptidase F
MVHEGGHAIHSFLCKDLELVDFKSPPSEIAELASMSMELISMEHWHVFFEDKEELKRAKRQQLESVMDALPWIAAVDKFQHWIYLNPEHTVAQRYESWSTIMNDFGSDVINYQGLEANLKRRWQIQLHLFEVPFYYIEYGFAQLGAIAMWRNYKTNAKRTIDQYKAALGLGYTKPIPQVYEAAGIKFDFSPAYVKELMDFVKKEYDEI